MRFLRTELLLALFCLTVFSPVCETPSIIFENPKINAQDKIIFTAKTGKNEPYSYRTLFLSDAKNFSERRILTCFPEKMEMVSLGASSVLQIRNRYGIARYAPDEGKLSWVTRDASVTADSIRLVPREISPDGKWLCYVKKTGVGQGFLMLKNIESEKEVVLDADANFGYDSIPVKWSPDSKTLIYSKKGNIYFSDPKAEFSNIQISEEFRKIGAGTIHSVFWANSKTIVYLNKNLVYKIAMSELYTRGLYSSLVGSGVVAGRIPFYFDSKKDRFYVDSKAERIALITSDSIISLFKLTGDASSYLTSVYSSPFCEKSGEVLGCEIFWSEDSDPLLWVNLVAIDDGKRKSSVYRISEKTRSIETLETIESSVPPAVSPDGRKIAFSSGDSLFVRRIRDWKELGRLSGEKTVSLVWGGATEIFVGGEFTGQKWNLQSGETSLIFLSSVDKAVWSGNSILALNSENSYIFDFSKNFWFKTELKIDSVVAGKTPTSEVQNGKFRVFVGECENRLYENSVFVRNLAGGGETKSIFPDAMKKSPERKRVSLIFDALDSDEGLSKILAVLSEYNIKATFFLNGEFIRRYPAGARLIANSGHECANMFFAAADLTSQKGFVIDEEFIQRGLARNEDEFFNATGKELSLKWHAPFYKSTREMRLAGEKIGYSYVEAGRFSLDRRIFERSNRQDSWKMGTNELISFYMNSLTDGSVIPVSIGRAEGTHDDALYEKLDILISTLLESGFEFER